MPGGFTIGTQLNYGFPGTISRGGNAETFARPNKDVGLILFGDVCFLNPDSAGGTYSSTQNLVSGPTVVGATATSTALTLAATAPAYLVVGSVIVGPGIPIGTTASVVSGTAVTLSAAATATASGQTFTILGANAVAAQVSGIAVREVKTNLAFPPNNSVFGGYAQGQSTDVLNSGFVSVQCLVGTPVAGGAVFLRVALNSGVAAGVIGGIEAAADSIYTIPLINMNFATGLLDGNFVTEIQVKANK